MSRIKWLLLGIVLTAFQPNGAHAGGSDCLDVKNSDERALCEAVVNKNPQTCKAIRDPDTMAACDAMTSGNPMKCYAIRDNDALNFCVAVIRYEVAGCSMIQNAYLRAKCVAFF